MVNQQKAKEFFKKNMGLIGSLGQLLFYAQAYSIFAHQKSTDVSLVGFGISVISLSCWLYYGYLIKDKALMTANTLGLVGALLVVLGISIYN